MKTLEEMQDHLPETEGCVRVFIGFVLKMEGNRAIVKIKEAVKGARYKTVSADTTPFTPYDIREGNRFEYFLKRNQGKVEVTLRRNDGVGRRTAARYRRRALGSGYNMG